MDVVGRTGSELRMVHAGGFVDPCGHLDENFRTPGIGKLHTHRRGRHAGRRARSRHVPEHSVLPESLAGRLQPGPASSAGWLRSTWDLDVGRYRRPAAGVRMAD